MNFESTQQNVAWFRDRYLEGTLIIKPPFQRKPVWAARQKCSLVESILMDLPVPEIYIQQTTTPEGKVTYAIVDGQQRTRAVLQFLGAEIDPEEKDFNKFTLDKLEPNSEWRNKTINDLNPDEKKKLYGYKFAVRYLNTEDDEQVRDMFRRLNKFLTPLKPQELRHATFSGPFVKLIEKLADIEYWAENKIVSTASIRRMGDVEFVSELMIGTLHGPQGGSAAVLDEYYRQYEDYEDEFPEQRKGHRLFDRTLEMIQKVLPDIKATRWSNKTDFYTLFIAAASLLRSHDFSEKKRTNVRKALNEFEAEVDARLADEDAKASDGAVNYVRAVEKGANDKPRRAVRHAVMVEILTPFTHSRKTHS
ncbi:MAG: DUF262 domain-containing protein [Verrucomicrobia bacterium]|nr:DUF262 domain-containing protein [Verrucomicrobiota bacterium]